MRSLLIVIPFVLADWTLCADAAAKRGGARAFPAVVDDKRGGGRVFQLNDDDKRGGGRAFDILSEKRGGGRSFPVMMGDDSTEKRAFDASFEKRGGGRAFYLYDRNSNNYNNLMKRPGAVPVSSFVGDGISPYSLISDGWYRRKRPGARPFFGNPYVYTKKGGGRGFVVDSDEFSD